MIDLLFATERILSQAKLTVFPIAGVGSRCLAFENQALIGFVHAYLSADELVSSWRRDSEAVFRRYTISLQKADVKTWNLYTVLLATGSITSHTNSALHSIEEDLSGMRKIARSGINTEDDLKDALIALLPIQNAPMLEAVDIAIEIRARTRDVPSDAIDAFLSHRLDEDVIAILDSES